jgi:hypothetical protein
LRAPEKRKRKGIRHDHQTDQYSQKNAGQTGNDHHVLRISPVCEYTANNVEQESGDHVRNCHRAQYLLRFGLIQQVPDQGDAVQLVSHIGGDLSHPQEKKGAVRQKR